MTMKPHTVATINSGHCHQIRVQISRWRGQTKLDLKPYSATIPQMFMPCGAGVSIDAAKANELIKAIAAAAKAHTNQEGNDDE